MIRIAVVSDTHGDFRHVGAARARLGRVDWLLHAGDHLQDAARVALSLGVDPARVRAVAGNCDHPVREPLQLQLEIGGVRIMMTHGHRHGVKEELHRIELAGREAGARAVIFGHSHIAVAFEEQDLLLFNPGSLSQPRFQGDPPSCGLFEIADKSIRYQHLFLA